MGYLLVIDQGTTSSRAVLYDLKAQMIGFSQKEFAQSFPKPAYVEQDPSEMVDSVLWTIKDVLHSRKVSIREIIGIGITNQRETVIAWDSLTGKPICPAIVWQCKRTKRRCDSLKKAGWENKIFEKTGLLLDPYFSASKMEWILKHVKESQSLLRNHRLRMGTVDTYLMWVFSQGKIYKTDYTNASRTMLFNINTLQWDIELCDLFHIPVEILPQAVPSASIYGTTSLKVFEKEIPIVAVAGDQQSALFGQRCFHFKDLKVTYGTGCFLLLNAKEQRIRSSCGLLTTLSCETKDRPMYALEGSVFMGGALIQWLRDEVHLLSKASESEALARSVEDSGVYIVPAFTGMGAPYWKADAEGMITGLTRGTTSAHLVRAALEAIAYEVFDVIEAMKKDLQEELREIHVDGGASENSFLMQFQSDISEVNLLRAKNIEATALGTLYLAGLTLHLWTLAEIENFSREQEKFQPQMPPSQRKRLLKGWKKALRKSFLN